MNDRRSAELARRLFMDVQHERASAELRARILAAGRAEIERSRAGVARAPDDMAELVSTRRQREGTRLRPWMAVAAFAAAAALFAFLGAARAPEPGVSISAESGARAPSERAGAGAARAASVEVEAPPSTPVAPAFDPAPGARRQPAGDDDAARAEAKPPSAPAGQVPPPPTRAQSPAQTQSPTPAQTSAPSLGEQLAQIKRIRSALRAGEHRRALELIDAYRALPGGELAAEASLLRIEALALSGEREAAAREARQFARDYPNSPLIDRALGYAGHRDDAER